MNEQYSWITELRAELDKIDDTLPDYEQVAQLKQIEAVFRKKIKPVVDGLIKDDANTYLIHLQNEIAESIYAYTMEYIEKNRIQLKGFQISRGIYDGGRVKLRVNVDQGMRSTVKMYCLGNYLSSINYKKIITEMTGIEYVNDHWATRSIYEAFQEAKKMNPDWVQEYMVDIVNALDRIKEKSSRKKAVKNTKK